MTSSEKYQRLNKETGDKSQRQILLLKNTTKKILKSMHKLNSQMYGTENKLHELTDKTI